MLRRLCRHRSRLQQQVHLGGDDHDHATTAAAAAGQAPALTFEFAVWTPQRPEAEQTVVKPAPVKARYEGSQTDDHGIRQEVSAYVQKSILRDVCGAGSAIRARWNLRPYEAEPSIGDEASGRQHRFAVRFNQFSQADPEAQHASSSSRRGRRD